MAFYTPVLRQAVLVFSLASASTFAASTITSAQTKMDPVVFWLPDRATPGDILLLVGHGLAEVDTVRVWRLPDAKPGLPPSILPDSPGKDAQSVKPLQVSDHSLKFQLPEKMAPGVFALRVLAGTRSSPILVLNRPELWFLQPTVLRPGLAANQAPPGAEVQVIGKNLSIHGESTPRPRLALRSKGGGAAIGVSIVKSEPFSIIARLPADVPPGCYELFAHPGKGGTAGWGEPLAVEVKLPESWPSQVFNVRDFGAKGDDVTDDSRAVRDALAAAAKNGGGVVFFPWGTYRISDWLLVPERTILRGEIRDGTVLKWPCDVPGDLKDFARAAVFIGPRCGLEDLTLVARRVENVLLDVQFEHYSAKTIPPEIAGRLRPWGQGGNIFLRRLIVHHLLLAGRPEQQKAVMETPALQKRYWEGLRNIMLHDGPNCEVSDCVFEGGHQQFTNLVNGRIVRNQFANHMGISWTALGGGAVDVVCEGNDIRGASSWGWGWTGMQRVYSAHNTSHNFVRGERETMTLDISALPTARPVCQYWGSPVEIGGGKDKPFLRFPAADQTSPHGFKTGWVPGCFQGGMAIIREATGGPSEGQARPIIDNTADTVFLEKPFALKEEISANKLTIEIAPRHHRAHLGTTAWLGSLLKSETDRFTAKDARWIPQEFVGMTALVLDGKGIGQYRRITSNSANQATLEKPWDVIPDEASVVGIWSLMRHMVVYDCKGFDTSAFAQLYGSFYDYLVEGCRVERTQGLWGQMGWFVQFRDNLVSYHHAYHPGIGMRGPNPEKNAPFGYTGLENHRLRITKSASLQFPDRKLPLFADEVVGRPVPSTLGHIQRGNTLRYGQRIVVQPWTGDSEPGPRPGGDLFRDVILDGNTIEHSAVGILLGPNVGGAVLGRNIFRDVARPVWAAMPKKVLDLGPGDEGELLVAGDDRTGWVEEQHDFFRKKNPDAHTWSVKDGVIACDGSLGNCGFLRYDKKLADFTLRLEYRMSKKCNSGVCIRVPTPYDGNPDKTIPSRTGYEVQILDDAGDAPSLTCSGSFYCLVAPEVNAARPAGEWNELEIICRGPKIRVTLNGRIVQNVDQTQIGAIHDRPRSGYLLLQNHGHAIEFRNIRLKINGGGANQAGGGVAPTVLPHHRTN